MDPAAGSFKSHARSHAMTELLEAPSRMESLLADCGQHELRRLIVTETDESIILEGRVSRFYLKQLAQEAVRSAADGRKLVNRIFVD
jgi:hypothetical protein